jgi:Fic family protein
VGLEARSPSGTRQKAPDSLAGAVDVVKRLAAIETGAIEGLYEIDRGVTITIATQAAMLDAALRKQEKAKSLIQSQLEAYDYVIDLATGRTPVSEAWIRQLHEVACGAQKTYRVITSVGEQDHQLVHGEYKKYPNHVIKAEGDAHAYAPVTQTPSEMARLISELQSEEFQAADAALQAAFAHHAFTSVHPFADGNGRVARALASVFTYRAARIPLLIVSEDKRQYFDALEAADASNFRPFVQFVVDSGRAALDLVIQSIRTAKKGRMPDALVTVQGLNRTRGGFPHVDVDAAAKRVGTAIHEALRKASSEWKLNGELTVSSALNFPQPHPVPPPQGCRAPTAGDNAVITVSLSTTAPADASVQLSLVTFVPVDCDAEDEYLVTCPELKSEFKAVMSDVHPRVSLAAQLRMQLWIEELGIAAVESLCVAATRRLTKRGLRPSGAGS